MRARLAASLALAAVVAGCGGVPATPREGGPLYFPALPEQPRFVYEGVLRSAASLRRGEDAGLRARVTGTASEEPALAKPLGVAAHRGRIYVSDSEERRIVVFDVPRGRAFTFGHRGEGRLAKPAGLAVDGAGRLYVADVTARRVHVYDALGLHLRSFGAEAGLVRPTGIAVDASGARVAVVDTGGVESARHRIVVFDGAGREAVAFGRRGAEPGAFNLPVDAAFAPDGTLYVLDAGNFRVQAFDAAYRPLRAFGTVGNGAGQFARPRGIACDADGNVYVSDAAFGNVQVFRADGTLLLAVGRAAATDAPAAYRLPAGLAVDETRRLYVVDQFHAKVEVLRFLGEAEGRRLAGLE